MYVCMHVTFQSLYVFKTKEWMQLKIYSPKDSISKNAYITVSSKIYILNNFKAAIWDVPASQTSTAKTSDKL